MPIVSVNKQLERLQHRIYLQTKYLFIKSLSALFPVNRINGNNNPKALDHVSTGYVKNLQELDRFDRRILN